jgi:hypothetical protein
VKSNLSEENKQPEAKGSRYGALTFSAPERSEGLRKKVECALIEARQRIINEEGEERTFYYVTISTVTAKREDVWLEWRESVQNHDEGEVRRWKLFVHFNIGDKATGGSVCAVNPCSTEPNDLYSVTKSAEKRMEAEEIRKLTERMHWVSVHKIGSEYCTQLFKTILKTED